MNPCSLRMRQISPFSREAGRSSRSFFARWALRIRASRSEIGSVALILFSCPYQLALTTPGR